jgi:hypothetical protein
MRLWVKGGLVGGIIGLILSVITLPLTTQQFGFYAEIAQISFWQVEFEFFAMCLIIGILVGLSAEEIIKRNNLNRQK